MQVHRILDNRQSQPGSLDVAHVAGTVKRFEQTRDFVGWNAIWRGWNSSICASALPSSNTPSRIWVMRCTPFSIVPMTSCWSDGGIRLP
jgi:hypothetical protein